jgi:ubiquinol-cytochrome c reductase cytochrome b subunit
VIRRATRWADERLGTQSFLRKSLNKVFPDHWSFMIGEIALYSFVILLLTGVYLTFFFSPDTTIVVYDGSYKELQGVEMTAAFKSTLDVSFDVRAGLVMRQMHHWAALLFVASTTAHLLRIFFTGAFRKPREINWVIGLLLMLMAIGNGFTGYSLPDDLLSGTGLRIAYSVAQSIPIAGNWVAFLVFGGEYPGNVIPRLYVIHILIIPAAIVGLLSAHLAIIWRQKHTQFAGKGRTETNVVGSRLYPNFAMKSLGLFLMTAAVLAGLGGLVQINPIWLYGPYDPAAVTAGSQPDWYIGWLEGALRLMPPWEVRAFDRTIPNPFFPGVLLPGVLFTLLFVWPWLEAWVSKDKAAHHILDRPRDRPKRSAFGVGASVFYLVIFLAGGNDVLAQRFQISVNAMTKLLQVALFVGPVVAYFVTYLVCRELRDAGVPITHPSVETGILVRTPDGGYVEVERDPAEVEDEATPTSGASL